MKQRSGIRSKMVSEVNKDVLTPLSGLTSTNTNIYSKIEAFGPRDP